MVEERLRESLTFQQQVWCLWPKLSYQWERLLALHYKPTNTLVWSWWNGDSQAVRCSMVYAIDRPLPVGDN